MNFSNARISTKLIAAFAVILAVFTLSAGALFLSLNTTLEAARKNNVSYQNSQDVAGILSATIEQQNAMRGFAATADAKFLNNYEKNGAAVDKHIADFQVRTTQPLQVERADKLKTIIVDWRSQNAGVIDLARDPATIDQARALVGTVRLTKVREAQGELMKAQNDLVASRWETQQKAIGQARLTLILGSLGALAAACLMAWLLSRAIAAPVGAMTRVMGRLASGDNTVDVPALGRKDEVGEMAQAVLAFKDAAIEKLRVEGEVAHTRATAEAERRAAEESRAIAAREQAVVVESLARGLSQLSDGDLTFRIEAAFAVDYAQLKSDFNAAMDRLQDTMTVISGNTASMQSGAGEISTAADDLSRRTEQQAAGLEETAAALDEITATVKKTAEGANHASKVVATARADAQESAVIVNRATEAMGEIEGSSKQIGQIIGVIDEIAFQTNLLALNAGFAVVASEVRALAQRSAEAAKEIKALINASSAQVGAGVELVAETGKALQRIATQVAEINASVVEIAASAQEQAVGLQQVNTAVNQMDQVTQQNAAMVEQSTAASHALANEAIELARLMGQFNIGSVAPQIETRRPAARTAAKPLRVKGYAARGNAAVKYEPASDADSWEEF
ncbi:methyl-accepting chemotaxis protein [Phenylobacterium sp.]|uniref:methyl-accepting chemotaxis protein n=1 Tax=Phenylobacterium sp. TaxID=1871053 RepID=UPI0027357132|nr:methyl-accepting chemotaxis protein [Phenylobacterium sp.]MDP3854694.1 methyl-accepting chemotaxis protein [Phenylobacterium sp.]